MDFQFPNYTYHAKLVNIINGRCLNVDLNLGFGSIRRQRLRFAGLSDHPAPEDERWLRELLSEMDELVIRTVKDGHFLTSAHVWVVEKEGWSSHRITYVNSTLTDDPTAAAGDVDPL